ncbi:MAG: hypothetical protein IBX50_09335 [Marinospirillum sp.]|uniref:hypothetical protein n=1 Tax=Marinospirillum sp. TaxID=2183934 RepID=UPI001A03F6B3|nr:hypothetical protein [Marinospirillum sp.]MBE0506904.1 hypothetical protein [Marinospirillum sp.]
MAKCQYKGCSNEAYDSESSLCILHCKKTLEFKDKDEFESALNQYVESDERIVRTKASPGNISGYKKFTITGVDFPWDGNVRTLVNIQKDISYDYVNFVDCTIRVGRITNVIAKGAGIPEPYIYFEKCSFSYDAIDDEKFLELRLFNYQADKREEKYRYHMSFFDSTFCSDLNLIVYDNSPKSRRDTGYTQDFLFKKCHFLGSLKVDTKGNSVESHVDFFKSCRFGGSGKAKLTVRNLHFLGESLHDCSFEKIDLDIKDSYFKERVSLNGGRFSSIFFKGLKFAGKFEIKYGSDKYNLPPPFCIKISNVDFLGVSDFNGAPINELEFRRVDFRGFFAFEDVGVIDKGCQGLFEYVTFHNHATFRGAKFLGGLNLDRANFSGEANFLGVDADGGNIANTTRETYRLIKHSFDKIGNHLEANKFFAKEMDKYREEVSGNKSLPLWDRAVFHINKNVSDFGQNYLLSIGWLLLSMVFYFYTFVLHRHFGLIHPKPSCDVFGNWYDKVNCLASGMIPFNSFLTSGMELLSLLFYMIFAVLVWQTVVALKRHIRR